MDVTGIGTAVMLVVAAGLWFLYLVPTWLKRREYLSTERTATRLQQTLRVMAETAETPEIVHVEASARDAAQQERLLRMQERAAERRRRAELELAQAELRRAEAVARADRTATRPASRRSRSRRSRMLASLLMVAATVVGVVQVVLMATTGAAAASWLVLAACGGGAAVAVGMQRRLDAVAAPRTAAVPVAAAPAVASRRVAAPAAPVREWTPVPVPKPRYLDQPARQAVVPAADSAALLRAAAAEAERARRAALAAALAEPEVVPFRRPEPVPSRFAAMGVLRPEDTAAPDVDAAFRRRSAG